MSPLFAVKDQPQSLSADGAASLELVPRNCTLDGEQKKLTSIPPSAPKARSSRTRRRTRRTP